MLLTVDIGNTNITLGAYNGNILTFTARLSTEQHKTADQYAVELQSMLALNGYAGDDIEDCIIASVVPQVGKSMSNAVSKLCHIVPLMLGPGVKTGLNIKIDNPAQLGADLVAGAVGAIDAYTMPCVVIDMGTATKIMVMDKEGAFTGAAIIPGVNIGLNALASGTAQLPQIGLEAPKSVVGKNTVDCMLSGVVFGNACLIDGMIERFNEEMGEELKVYATGGLSQTIIPHCKHEIIIDENMVLKGLNILYKKNS